MKVVTQGSRAARHVRIPGRCLGPDLGAPDSGGFRDDKVIQEELLATWREFDHVLLSDKTILGNGEDFCVEANQFTLKGIGLGPDIKLKRSTNSCLATLFNDKAYGNVLRAQIKQFDGRVIGSRLHNPDFVVLAHAFGARGIRADGAAALESALRESLETPAPTVIEVPVGMMEREF